MRLALLTAAVLLGAPQCRAVEPARGLDVHFIDTEGGAAFNNGPRKGGHPRVTATLRRVPGIKAIYQLHRNVTVGARENTEPAFIANPDEKCQGESIRLSVAADGKSYSVTVGSKGRPHRYRTRQSDK